jgi:hypothetical protein
MLHRTQQAHSHLNSYHHTDSLLFQFVLYEFIATLEEAKRIEDFIKKDLDSEHLPRRLVEYLVRLAGSELDYMRIFSWIYDSGVLTKLKNYSDLLSQKAEKEDKDYIKLHNSTHRAWLMCLHCVDLVRAAGASNSTFEQLEVLKQATLKALAAIKKLIPEIKKLIPKYADDENVIYFLIRHKEAIDRLLTPQFLKLLFKKMFNDNLSAFLVSRYKIRGFEHLLPQLDKAASELYA